jgi:hypothetical protein
MGNKVSSDYSNYHSDNLPIETQSPAQGEKQGRIVSHSAEIINTKLESISTKNSTILESAANASQVGLQIFSNPTIKDEADISKEPTIFEKNFISIQPNNSESSFLQEVKSIYVTSLEGKSINFANFFFKLIQLGEVASFERLEADQIIDENKESLFLVDEETYNPAFSEDIQQRLEKQGIKTFVRIDEEGNEVSVTPIIVSNEEYNKAFTQIINYLNTYLSQSNPEKKAEEKKKPQENLSIRNQQRSDSVDKKDSGLKSENLEEVKLPTTLLNISQGKLLEIIESTILTIERRRAEDRERQQVAAEKTQIHQEERAEDIKQDSRKKEIRDEEYGKVGAVPITDVRSEKNRKTGLPPGAAPAA